MWIMLYLIISGVDNVVFENKAGPSLGSGWAACKLPNSVCQAAALLFYIITRRVAARMRPSLKMNNLIVASSLKIIVHNELPFPTATYLYYLQFEAWLASVLYIRDMPSSSEQAPGNKAAAAVVSPGRLCKDNSALHW